MVESIVRSLSYGRIIVKAPGRLRGLVPDSLETYQIVEPLDESDVAGDGEERDAGDGVPGEAEA